MPTRVIQMSGCDSVDSVTPLPLRPRFRRLVMELELGRCSSRAKSAVGVWLWHIRCLGKKGGQVSGCRSSGTGSDAGPSVNRKLLIRVVVGSVSLRETMPAVPPELATAESCMLAI